MSELAAFQDRFANALRQKATLTGADPASLNRGLRVHRNTVFKALVDALRDNYPTVARLVGEEWFAASAGDFLHEHFPREPALATFGDDYPEFLSTLPAAVDLPYLPGVARIDRFWTEAHVAADADVLSLRVLAGVSVERFYDLRLPLHPGVRIGWFDEPAPSIWRSNRPPAPLPERMDFEWVAQGALVARPHGEVGMVVLDLAGFVFLEKCRDGATLGEAAMAALEIEPGADLQSKIARFIDFGAFAPDANFAPSKKKVWQ